MRTVQQTAVHKRLSIFSNVLKFAKSFASDGNPPRYLVRSQIKKTPRRPKKEQNNKSSSPLTNTNNEDSVTMTQARSIQMYAQEGSDDVAPPTPYFPTGIQAAVAFRADHTPHSERREGAGGGTAAGGTRFAYRDLGGDPRGIGNNSQVSLSLCVILETWTSWPLERWS